MTHPPKYDQNIIEQFQHRLAQQREHIVSVDKKLQQSQSELAKSEVRARNLQIELERLKRENAELRSR